jgi:hypothetical protein
MESDLVLNWAWRFLNLKKCVRTGTTRDKVLKVRRTRLKPAEHPNFLKESKTKTGGPLIYLFLKTKNYTTLIPPSKLSEFQESSNRTK